MGKTFKESISSVKYTENTKQYQKKKPRHAKMQPYKRSSISN